MPKVFIALATSMFVIWTAASMARELQGARELQNAVEKARKEVWDIACALEGDWIAILPTLAGWNCQSMDPYYEIGTARPLPYPYAATRGDGTGIKALVDDSVIVRVIIPGNKPCENDPGWFAGCLTGLSRMTCRFSALDKSKACFACTPPVSRYGCHECFAMPTVLIQPKHLSRNTFTVIHLA